MRNIIVIAVCLAILILSGCAQQMSEVRLSPRYQQALEMSAFNVANMCEDCKNGNQKSCVDGLEAASKLLDHIVDASYGRDGE